MRRVRDLINESGAGLWGTDKARERLQKDTPGQEIKSLVKKSQKVSEAADPKGTIKVVKQDKVRYITKDELNTYRQMGWKQVEKRPQGDDKIRAAKKAYAAGTWDGNVNKDGKPIVHIDGKPVVVEDVKNPYKAYDSQKLQRLKKNMRDNVANLTQRIRKRAGNASQSLKDELKDLERKSKLIDIALRDSAKQVDAKRTGVGSDRETFRDRQNRLGQPQTEQVSEEQDTLKMVNKNGTVVYATRDKVKHYMDLGYKSAAYVDARKKTDARTNIPMDKAYKDVQRIARDLKNKKPGDTPPRYNESVEQLDELKVSFKFDKLADAAKAERKANQMKKLDVKSEKIQGKLMWLLHVTGSFTDIMKYLRRYDLENKVHESVSIDEGMLDTLKQRVQQAQDALKKFRDSETAKRVRDDQRARIEKGKKVLDAPNLRKKFNRESIEEGSESWEDGYKRRVVKTTKPEHKEKGYNWRIKGKDKAHLTIKLYKDKPSQEEFNKQMKRVAGHEFGG